jgi:hypothetical protein
VLVGREQRRQLARLAARACARLGHGNSPVLADVVKWLSIARRTRDGGARKMSAGILFSASPQTLCAALRALARHRQSFVREWLAALGHREAHALVAKLEEDASGSSGAVGSAQRAHEEDAYSSGDLSSFILGEGPSAERLRTRLINRSEAYGMRVCARAVSRALGL